MTNEKLLDFLVARLVARETAALALVTISSSASLVLLALDLESTDSWVIPVVGILFPLVGITYNEVTFRTIHTHDHEWIRKIIREDKETTFDSDKILPFEERRRFRILLARVIMFIPVAGWVILLPPKIIPNISSWVTIIGIVAIIISIIVLVITSPPRKPIE